MSTPTRRRAPLLSPEIAVRAAPVAGTVLLAPPARPPWDLVVGQMRYLGLPEARVAEAEAAARLLREGRSGPGRLLGAPASYWQDWASRDGVAMARRHARPILVMRGERDFQVTSEDLAIWRQGLANVAGAEVVTLPGANHLFITGSGQPGLAEYEVPGHVDERVVTKVATFLMAASPGAFSHAP